MRLTRLAYLLAAHPLRLHQALVRRGLALQWIDAFRPYWEVVRPPSLPLTDYASFTWLEYHFAQVARARHPVGDHFDDPDFQLGRLLSYVKRRELHPLRMLPAIWALHECDTVLEFGSGAAPYAYARVGLPPRQWITLADLPGPLFDYVKWQYRDTDTVDWQAPEEALECPWDGIVCTEVLEHLPDPLETVQRMTKQAPHIVFDYTPMSAPGPRYAVFRHFETTGVLTGPDPRGLYRWHRA